MGVSSSTSCGLDNGFWMIAIFEQLVFECLGAAQEQAAKNAALFKGTPERRFLPIKTLAVELSEGGSTSFMITSPSPIDLLRCRDLSHPALVHDGYPIGRGERLVLIVRDANNCLAARNSEFAELRLVDAQRTSCGRLAQLCADLSGHAPRGRDLRIGGNIELDFMRQLDDRFRMIAILAQCEL